MISSGSIDLSCKAGMTYRPKNALDVLQFLQQDVRLSPRLKTDLISAVRCVVRALTEARSINEALLAGFGLEDLSGLDRRLTRLLRTAAAPLKAAISRFRRALRHAGLPLRNGRGRLPLNALWSGRVRALSPTERNILLPLIQYFSETGIANVGDGDVAAFAAAHMPGKNHKSACQYVRRIVTTWNTVCGRFGLAVVAQPVPYLPRDRYVWPLSSFSPQVRQDFARFRALARRIETHSPTQIERIIGAVRRVLSAACRTLHCAPDHIATVSDLLDGETLRAALTFMIQRAQRRGEDVDRTPGAYIAICSVIQFFTVLLARNDPRLDDLKAVRQQLTPDRAVRLSPVTQSKLADAWHPETIAALLRLPHRLYDRFDARSSRTSKEVLTELSHACALELLLRTGLAPPAVAALVLNDTLAKRRTDAGEWRWHVRAPPRHGRCETPWIPLADDSHRLVEIYLRHVRVRRPGADGDAVFPNRVCAPCTTNSLGIAIANLTSRHLGQRITARRVHFAIVGHIAQTHSPELAMNFAGHISGHTSLIRTAVARAETLSAKAPHQPKGSSHDPRRASEPSQETVGRLADRGTATLGGSPESRPHQARSTRLVR